MTGVNVVIKNNGQGASTDIEGEFYLIGYLRKYDILISYIGYAPLTIKDVLVRADLTSDLDIKIKVEAIEGAEVEVIADRLMVQKDITFTRKLVTEEDFANIPGFESQEMFLECKLELLLMFSQSGLIWVMVNSFKLEMKALKNVHVRGGRGGEILYMVDGMPVTHPLYGGRSVLDLNVSDVSQVEILTGAFSAEYGQAQSGVVNNYNKNWRNKISWKF